MNKQFNYSFTVNSRSAETRSLNNEEYYVFPVVMLKQGIWNGVEYTFDELSKSSVAWNGMDLLIDHPMNADGSPHLEGTTPEIWERQGIGKIWNARINDSDELVAEVWFNKNKLKKFSALENRIISGDQLEFSTGLFGVVHNQNTSEQPYVSPIIPDHLAVLPNKKGACSLEDGCGGPNYGAFMNAIRNALDKIGLGKKEEDMVTENILKILKNEYNGGDETKISIEHIQNSEDGDNTLVFGVCRNDQEEFEYFKQEFKQEDGKIEFTSDPLKVNKTFLEDEVIDNEDDVEEEEEGLNIMDKDVVINELIEKEAFTEGEKTFLNGLSDYQLEVLQARELNREVPSIEEMIGNVSEEDSEALVAAKSAYEAVQNGDNMEPATIEEFVDGAPEEFKSVLKDAVASHNEKKVNLVESLVNNERCDFEKEVLEDKSIQELESLVKLANVEVSYVGNENQDPEEEDGSVPAPPRMKWNSDDEE